MTTINGKVAQPDTIVRNGDRIEYVVVVEGSLNSLTLGFQEYCASA